MTTYRIVLDRLGSKIVSYVATDTMIRGIGKNVHESLLSLATELLEMANFYKLMAVHIPYMEQECLLAAQTYISLSQQVTEQEQRIHRQLSMLPLTVCLN